MTGATIAAAVNGLTRTIQANPEKARAKHAPASATLLAGLKCRVTGPSGERIDTDMPAAMGGEASCPNPGWYFRASLAACCATVIAQRAACLGVDLINLEVTVESDGDVRGLLGMDDTVSAGNSAIRTNVRIGAANATPDQLRELVRWATGHSPVGCTVRDAPPNALQIVIA
jgi:uncharacterized OsmC-like protein